MFKKDDKGEDPANRRKTIVVDPGALWRLSIPFFILLITILVVSLFTFKHLSSALTANGTIDQQTIPALALIRRVASEIMVIDLIGLTIVGILCFVLWVTYSHRIFGPIVAIRRHVQAVIDGNFDSRIHLRKFDEFKDLAADLNRLTEKLELRSKEKSKTETGHES
jgi:methyl-accepting chemotaxis protein